MKNEMIYLFLAHETEKILLTHFLEELCYTVQPSQSTTREKWLQSDILIVDEIHAQHIGQEILKEKQKLSSLFMPTIILLSDHQDESTCFKLGFDAILRLPIQKEELASKLSLLTRFKQQYVIEYRLIFENIDIGIYRLSSDNKIILANQAFANLLGYRLVDSIMHKKISELGVIVSEHHASALKEIQSTGHAPRYESIWTRVDGSEIHVVESYIAFTSTEGHHYYYATTIQDITTRKLAERSLIDSKNRITYMAHHDALTDLCNREKLNLILDQALLNAQKNQEQVACIYMDLDWFKSINASCGQVIGDKVLRETAFRIKKASGITDKIARVGADEFVIVFVQGNSFKDSLVALIKKIRAIIAIPFIIDNHTLHIKTSIGISIYPADGVDASTLFKNAYTAMFSAKKSGGDRYEFCSPALSKSAQDKSRLEEQLRQALSNDEFYIQFQPKLCLKTNKITGVEALLRWNNPMLGELAPSYFIPLAEEIGLITPLTEIMFTQVCRHINHWKHNNKTLLNVAINLSGKSFIDLKFMDVIASILKQQRIDPSMITIEITESVLMQEIESNASILKEFTDMGLKISIDDFGTGYSSLNYLKYFTVDSLKIDQSFVRDLTTSSSDSLIIKAIIAMAHSLKFKVIAEGVETEEQLDFLKKNGCDEIQGYLFCKPMLLEDLLKFVEHR